MSMKSSATANAWLPEDFGDMLSLVVQSKSVAAQVSKKIGTNSKVMNFKLLATAPTVGWYDELDEIAASDAGTSEVVVVPKKTAGLTLMSNELADDSDPDIADQVAHEIANQIAESIDTAYFAKQTAKANDGLLNKAFSSVDTGAGGIGSNLDNFIKARYLAEKNKAKLTHWVMTPDTAEALSLMKRATDSNESLIEFVEDGITVAGLPVITSTHVDAATAAWGIDHTQQRYVTRKDTRVERFESVTNDGLWIRGISRIGWDTLNPAGIVRIWDKP